MTYQDVDNPCRHAADVCPSHLFRDDQHHRCKHPDLRHDFPHGCAHYTWGPVGDFMEVRPNVEA